MTSWNFMFSWAWYKFYNFGGLIWNYFFANTFSDREMWYLSKVRTSDVAPGMELNKSCWSKLWLLWRSEIEQGLFLDHVWFLSQIKQHASKTLSNGWQFKQNFSLKSPIGENDAWDTYTSNTGLVAHIITYINSILKILGLRHALGKMI